MAKSRRTRIVLSEQDRERLEKIKTDPHSILKHVQRATIILHLGDGLTLTQTMTATGMSKPTVRRWWDRFLEEGVDGLLYDKPRRRGRKPISEDKVSELIELAMSPPPEHASHWCQVQFKTDPGFAFKIDPPFPGCLLSSDIGRRAGDGGNWPQASPLRAQASPSRISTPQ